jgi:hypothetical protein
MGDKSKIEWKVRLHPERMEIPLRWKKPRHRHYWHYEHTIWEGRPSRQNEVGVVRFCACGVKQMAFTHTWRKPPKSYDLDAIGIGNTRPAILDYGVSESKRWKV